MKNFLVHTDDGAGNPTGEPIYSGDKDGCLRFVNASGINSLHVLDSETSNAVTTAFIAANPPATESDNE